MSKTSRFMQVKLRLPDKLGSLPLAGLHSLYNSRFMNARKQKVTTPFTESPQPQVCPACQSALGLTNELYSHTAICDYCGYHFVWSARNRIEHLADAGSFRPVGRRIQPVDFLGFVDEQPYFAKLIASQKQTGLNDAILTGRCRIGGTESVLAVLDFHFLGGSMGSVVGEEITLAFEYATKHRLPVVTVVTSGGARMQEGIISLMQMPKTAAAVRRFQAAGLFYLSILASPTTGGVFASFASLGDVLLAEPGAIIGFAGPRVAEHVTGRKLAAGSHRAEMLLASGQLDAIIPRYDLPHVVATLLHATKAHEKRHSHSPHAKELPVVTDHAPALIEHTAWERVNLARHLYRPTARDYIRSLSPNFLELQGDRCYGDDPIVVAGLGDIDGHTVIFVGQERSHSDSESHEEAQQPVQAVQTRPQPEGFRKAIRMMGLAAQLHCPLVTFVDTTGADPGDESERHGIAWSLAHCLSTMSSLPVPTIAVIIGEGASGGAVALAAADSILMLENAIYEVISPEGAATILFRNAQKAREVTEQLKLTAADCLRLGVIDAIVPEPPAGAQSDPPVVMQALSKRLLHALAELEQVPPKQLLARRYRKFRRHGFFQTRPPLMMRASASAVGRGRSLLLHLKGWRPLTIPARVSKSVS